MLDHSAPLHARASLLLAIVAGTSLGVAPSIGFAAPTSERVVVEQIGKARASLRRSATGVAKARVGAASVWPNLSLSVSREQILGAGQASDNYATLDIPIAVGGQRRIARTRASFALEIARQRASLATRRAQLAGRAVMIALCATRARLDALKSVIARLSKLASAAEARLQRGESSRYHAKRLVLELSSRRLQAVTTRARLDRLRGRLGALLGRRAAPKLSTTPCLRTPSVPSHAAVVAAIDKHPVLALLRVQKRRAERLATTQLGDVLPQFTVTAGWRGSRVAGVAGNGDGFVVGLRLPLPLFDRGQGRRQLEAARRKRIAVTMRLARRQAMARAQTARRALTRTVATIAPLVAAQARAAGAVMSAVDALHAAGEGRVFRVVDAYRASLDARLLTITARRAARELLLEIARAAGDPYLGLTR